MKDYKEAIRLYKEALECLKNNKKIKEEPNNTIILTYKRLEEIFNNNEEKIKKNFEPLIKIITKIDIFKDRLKVIYTKNTIIAHYTKPDVIVSILKAKDKNPYFRLYEVCYMNDPEEGKKFIEVLENNGLKNLYELYKDENNDTEREYYTFIGSFIVGNNIEDIDKLFLWRTYGKDKNNEEAKGICICIKKEFFDQDSDNLSNYLKNVKFGTINIDSQYSNSKERVNIETTDDDEKFCLYKVIYEDTKEYKELIKVLKRINDYAKDLDLDDKRIRNLLKSLLDDLRYLVKSKHYKEEGEYRIIKTYNINDKRDKIKIDDDNKFPPRLYIEIEKDFTEYIDEIILGPRMENKEAWKTYLSYHKIKVRESNCKFK
jgi:hypothetical protein